MQELRFEVQGSAPDPYRIVFVKHSERNLSAYCSCPAGENGQYCKHRFNILAGITKGIVSRNESDVKVVKEWLSGTDLEQAINTMHKIENEAERIKRELAHAKKDVAKAMRD